jgi:hypothetical protein
VAAARQVFYHLEELRIFKHRRQLEMGPAASRNPLGAMRQEIWKRKK